MKEKVRVGIIGTGGIAGAYARAYHELEDLVEVVGLCDIVPDKAAAFGERFGFDKAKTFEDHQKMLERLKLDAVSVSTYNTAHAGPTIDALDAGLHVICEKPMSVTLDEAVSMAKAAKKNKRMLSIGFQTRYDPNVKALRDLVQSGILGDVYYVETGGGRRRGIPGKTFISKEEAGFGAIADIGCYPLDMALNALGYPKPLTVSSYAADFMGKNPKYAVGPKGRNWDPAEFNVEDFGVALVRLEGGLVLNFKIAWSMHMDTLGPAMFLGTDAGLKATSDYVGPYGGGWGAIASMELFHDIQGHTTYSPIPVQERQRNVFTEKVRDFVANIQRGGEAPIPGLQIVRNQAVIDGILRSAQTGREVSIDIPEI